MYRVFSIIKRLVYRIKRLIANKSGSAKKISFMRKQGMKIGERCHLETIAFGTEPYLIELGNHVAVANGTIFITHDAGIRCFRNEFPEDDVFGKIYIGDNVFVGMNCTILPNTYIGNNCIVGAGSVVRGKFPDNSVLMGNPAKVITSISVQRLFYRQSPDRLPTSKMSDFEKKSIVIDHFTKKAAGNK